MKIIRNFALAMLLIWILQLGFNFCANSVKNFVLENIKFSYDDSNEYILEQHRLIYGITGALAAQENNRDVEKGFKNGVLAGEVAYLGKEIARKKGVGIFGKAIHSLGVSMIENIILDKPLFSRYKIFLPPASLEFDIQKGVDYKLLFGSIEGIIVSFMGINNIIDLSKVEVLTGFDYTKYYEVLIENLKHIRLKIFEQGGCLSFTDSLLAGGPVFVFRKDWSDKMDGINIMGIITVDDLDVLPHEMIHSLQYREAGILNLLIEENLCPNFPVLISQDLYYFLLLPLLEAEAYEYDRVYKRKKKKK